MTSQNQVLDSTEVCDRLLEGATVAEGRGVRTGGNVTGTGHVQ